MFCTWLFGRFYQISSTERIDGTPDVSSAFIVARVLVPRSFAHFYRNDAMRKPSVPVYRVEDMFVLARRVSGVNLTI